MIPWYYSIPDALFIFLIAALAAGQTFITSKGSLYDKRYTKKFWKYITRRGWVVISFNLLIIGLLMWQKEQDDFLKDEKDQALIKEQVKRDSLITAAVDTSRKILFTDLSDAFKKNQLQIDSLTGVVTGIRDSTKNVVNNFPQADPLVVIESNGIVLDSSDKSNLKVEVDLVSRQASATNFKLKLYKHILDDQADRGVSSMESPTKTAKILKDGALTFGFWTKKVKPTRIHIYVIGTYTTLDGKKTYSVDDIYLYDVMRNMTTLFTESAKQRWKERYSSKL